MVDQLQLKILLNELKLTKNSKVLDLGCGPGLITRYVQHQTKCSIKGIDISKKAIDYANSFSKKMNKCTFIVDDIGKPEKIIGYYDAVLMLDVHYFIEDFLVKIPDYIKHLEPNGVFAVFSDEGTGEDSLDESNTKANETIIGQYLNENKIEYKGIELYKENREHWKRKKVILEKLKKKFDKENSSEIYKNRMEECQNECTGKGGRYLFLIKNSIL